MEQRPCGVKRWDEVGGSLSNEYQLFVFYFFFILTAFKHTKLQLEKYFVYIKPEFDVKHFLQRLTCDDKTFIVIQDFSDEP